MKKVALIFSVLLCVILLLVPFSAPVHGANSLNDLTKIYQNLSLYLVDDFFDESKYYDDFKKKLAEVGELLKRDDVTQKDIDTYYTNIKKAYSNMMKDTFDYSSLEILVSVYEKMDSIIFTEESWRRLEGIMDSVYYELDAPSLFQVNANTTEKDYHDTTNRHIAKFTTDFSSAYNRLELIDFTQKDVTKEELKAVLYYCSVTAREDLMGNDAQWRYYENARQKAQTAVNLRYPTAERMNSAMKDLLSAYSDLCFSVMDFTPIKTQISQHSLLTGESYSTASWARYTEEIRQLKNELEECHFIYFDKTITPEESKEKTSQYFNTLCESAVSSYQNLISIERYNHLKKLCNDNREATAMEGLEIKLNRLLSRVSEGDEVLQNPDASRDQVEEAIANLESARTDLNLAEYFLKEEQSKVLKQDVKTVRMIVIFTVLSLVLATVFACVVSRQFFGRIDWKR